MIERLFKWCIFISSYIPVFVMVFLNRLKSFSPGDIVLTWKENTVFWWIIISVSILSLIFLIFWLCTLKKISEDNGTKYPMILIKSNDSEILNFFVTFIIPILSLNPASWPSIVMNLILFVIEGSFFVSNNTLYYNILLIILGYHVYLFRTPDKSERSGVSKESNIVITKKKKADLLFKNNEVSQIGTTNIFYL